MSHLTRDEDVTRKPGIYDHVLSANERALSIRPFNDNMRREAYERQEGVCPACPRHFAIDAMEADDTMEHGRQDDRCKLPDAVQSRQPDQK